MADPCDDRVFCSNTAAANGTLEVKPADVSFLIKKEAKEAFVAALLRDYPDTVFQTEVLK